MIAKIEKERCALYAFLILIVDGKLAAQLYDTLGD